MARKRKMTPEEEEAMWAAQEAEEDQPGYYDNPTPEQKQQWIKEMEEAAEEEADYIVREEPDLAKCPCRDCEWREPDRTYGNSLTVDHGALLLLCDVYGDNKPSSIVYKGRSCPYYVKETGPKPIKRF